MLFARMLFASEGVTSSCCEVRDSQPPMATPNERLPNVPTQHEVDEARYLLVAGSYRSGSTALFSYLSAHPNVSPARVKETGYFLPLDEETPSEYRFGRDDLAAYISLFRSAASARTVRVEASPGYLFYGESARTIKATLPNARIVVSLREQVSWLVSWYKTLKALNLLDPSISFSEFVTVQIEDTRPWRQRPHAYRAVAHGHYARFVEDYLEVFGADRVLVTWFDHLADDPRTVMQRVASFAGLDPAPYDSYQFKAVNPSIKLRSQRPHEIYGRLRRRAVRLASVRPRTSETLKRVLPRIDQRFYGLITEPADDVQPDAELAVVLRELYADDNRRLADVVGEPVPWVRE